MKQDLLLFAWESAVVLSALGIGRSLLRLLNLQRQPLFVSGMLGVSAWIALGGVLNVLHLILAPLLFALVAATCLLNLLFFERARAADRSGLKVEAEPPPTLLFWFVLSAALALLGSLVLAGMHQNLWNFDDLQGYIVMAVKALQKHSLQPDFFCERRVQAGVGGANFLDSLMLVEGDYRAMQFIDSGFGLALYGLGIWSIGRRLRVSRTGVAIALLCLPFLTLIKVNLTIVYLSVAGILAIVYLLLDEGGKEAGEGNRAIALGLLAGGLLTTKSTNLPFVVLFFLAWAGWSWRPHRGTAVIRTLVVATITALVVAGPWSLQNKRIAGTYLYPILGKGIHASAYGLVPTPSHVGNPAQMIFVMLPALFLLSGTLLCSWKLTQTWAPEPRAALLAFLVASLLSIPIITYGLGGEAVDRYTAPFLMPSLLLGLLVLGRAPGLGAWVAAMRLVFAFAVVYCVLFLGIFLRWYRDDRALLFDAFGSGTHRDNGYYFRLTAADFKRELVYGARIQASLPVGATAIEDMQESFPFDFRRNTIYVQDMAGMASPAPGFPLLGSPAEVRRLLLANGIHYVIFDRTLECLRYSDWPAFLKAPQPHTSLRDLLRYPALAHRTFGWSHLEEEVSCEGRTLVEEVAQGGQPVFDDGHVLVARIE